jgi:hypothetical protein
VSRVRRRGSLGGVTVFAALVLLGLLGLVIAAGTEQRATAFSVDVPAADPVAIISPGQRVCEQRLAITAPTDGLTAWMAPGPTGGASFEVTLSSQGESPVRATLRPESAAPTTGLGALRARFSPAIGAGHDVQLCVRSTSQRVIKLLGGPIRGDSGALVLGGKTSPYSLALVFRSSHPQSVLSLMPAMFQRASLFKAGWVGAWTFWVLLFAVLAAVALGLGWSLRAAVRADESGG